MNTRDTPLSPQRRGGYRKKPLWIYIAAAVLILTPLGNLIWSLATLRIPNWYSPHVWGYWARYITPSTWILLGLLFFSGVALLFVRKWTWILTISTLAFVSIYDLFMIRQFSIMGTFAIGAMIAGTIAFGLVLYFTEFRQPYLNPKVRWWETSPRYKVDLPVSVRSCEGPATLVDISRSGVLIQFQPGATTPDIDGSTFVTLPTLVDLPCVVRRKTSHGFGLEFSRLDGKQKKQLKNFIQTLAEDPSKIYR